MRIVLFPSAYAPHIGGVEELTRRLARRLTGVGEEVEIWTHRHPDGLPARGAIDGIQIRRFDLPMPRASLRQLGSVPWTAAGSLRRLLQVARARRPDIVHVQCFSANGVYATAVSRLLKIPLVLSLQGETVMDDNDIYEHSTAMRVGLRAGLRQATAVTACSRFVLRDAESRFSLQRGVGSVVPNGVEPEPTEGKIPFAVPFPSFLFGLGRIVDKKGFDLLLSAYTRLASEHPRVGLVIGGDGVARAGLTDRVKELGLDGRVVLPGALSPGQVAWAMANASAFVLPSRIEPFGIVVLEAMRAGCPAVVSSRGGATEIVQNGRDGLVVDPFDTQAMAAAMSRLLVDVQFRRRLAEAGRVRASEFSWAAIAERYREIYRAVTSSGPMTSSSGEYRPPRKQQRTSEWPA